MGRVHRYILRPNKKGPISGKGSDVTPVEEKIYGFRSPLDFSSLCCKQRASSSYLQLEPTRTTSMAVLEVLLLLPSTNCSCPGRQNIKKSKLSNVGILRLRLGDEKISPSQIITCSKKSFYQDFQAFEEPKRLFPVTDAKFCKEQKLEKVVSSCSWDAPCFYILQLLTSNEFGSDLGDVNAAILVCLIGSSGNSILQRISLALTEDSQLEKELSVSDKEHFQRGQLDTITFCGPSIGDIKALWIGLESGSWRLGGLDLTVIRRYRDADLDIQYSGSQYDFEVDDVLLGEGGGTSVAELRPKCSNEFPVDKSATVTIISNSMQPSSSMQGISTARGMKEYSDLKSSLLLYDLALVSAGTTILTFSSSERATLAFSIGGLSGFLYLLLLQKSVDGLSSSSLPLKVKQTENMIQALGGLKGPLSRFVLVLAAFIAVTKYGIGDLSFDLTPQELLLGAVGFFTCKIAVVIAAFKPLGTNVEKD